MFESNPTWLAIRLSLDLKVYFEQAEMQAAAQPTDCSMRNLVMDVAFTVGQLPSKLEAPTHTGLKTYPD